MKIAIIGSRGMPNRYGGFEQFAEQLSVRLAARGMQVWVYNPHNHPCRDRLWKGVHRLFCYDPEHRLGQFGQFVYDLNCIVDSRRRGFDIILQLGTTSSTIWHRLLPRRAVVVTNMDGLEWQRSKYSRPVRRFLKHAERLGVTSSHHLVADSPAIQQYLLDAYEAPSTYIPYGAELPLPDGRFSPMRLEPDGFLLLIARLQPDNHVEEIIRGVLAAQTELPLLVVGNDNERYAARLRKQYACARVVFTGGIYDQGTLNRLRRRARLYFHGHSAGGTNPSLLEAMAAGAKICAHDNLFNRAVLGEDAAYFRSAAQITAIIDGGGETIPRKEQVRNNLNKIKDTYNWDRVTDAYEALFLKLCHTHDDLGQV